MGKGMNESSKEFLEKRAYNMAIRGGLTHFSRTGEILEYIIDTNNSRVKKELQKTLDKNDCNYSIEYDWGIGNERGSGQV